MKRKLLMVLFFVCLSITLFSCAGKESGLKKPTDNISNIIIPSNTPIESDPLNPTPTDQTEDITYTVSLRYNKKDFKDFDNKIYAIFYNGSKQEKVLIDVNTGKASIKNLDGVFSVYLSELPVKGTTTYNYNPNIYYLDESNTDISIELLKVYSPKSGNGTGLYSPSIYEMTATGSYCVEVKSSEKQVYFQFEPTKSGTYVFESYVNVYEDEINPICYRYNGTNAYKDETSPVYINDGGQALKNGFTKNFRFTYDIDKSNLGSVITMGLTCEVKNSKYPVKFYFNILNMADYQYEGYPKVVLEPQDIKEVTPNFSKSEYEYKTCVENIGGRKMLEGSHYKFNEDTGYYHVYDSTTDTFGPALVMSLTKALPYFDGDSFYTLEDHGNSALIIVINNIAYDYQGMLTGEKYYTEKVPYGGETYLNYQNSDGVVYLTKELKEFCQRYSVSQRLFMDGNGVFEQEGIYSKETDQWLFACGYYQKK